MNSSAPMVGDKKSLFVGIVEVSTFDPSNVPSAHQLPSMGMSGNQTRGRRLQVLLDVKGRILLLRTSCNRNAHQECRDLV